MKRQKEADELSSSANIAQRFTFFVTLGWVSVLEPCFASSFATKNPDQNSKQKKKRKNEQNVCVMKHVFIFLNTNILMSLPCQ